MPVPPRPRRPWYGFDLLAALDRLRAYLARLGDRGLCVPPPVAPCRPELAPLEPRFLMDGRPLPLPVIYAGAGLGGAPVVRAYAADTGALNFERVVYEPLFTGGVRVAVADLTGDGYPDLVTAPGPGGGPRVRVLDGKTGAQAAGPLGSFWAFEPGFTGGVSVAAADVDRDGVPDVIAAAGPGGGPHVRVFSGRTGAVVADFFALDPDFRGGVTVAAADLTGDGRAEVAVGAGPGGGPRVKVYDPTTWQPIAGPLGSFFAFDPAFRGGVYLGADALAGDVDGDGTPDLAVGTGPGAAPRVRVLSGRTGGTLLDLAPFAPDAGGEARVALAYVTDDPYADVVVGSGPGRPGAVRVFDGRTGALLPPPVGEYTPFGGAYAGGVYVAASNDPTGGTITGYVYADANTNYARDSGEAGVSGVLVESLVWSMATNDWEAVASDTTDGDGHYALADVPADAATVRFTLPTGSGYVFSYTGSGQTTTLYPASVYPGYTAYVDIPAYPGSSPPPPPPPPVVVTAYDVTSPLPEPADVGQTDGTFVLHRTGPLDSPLTVNYTLSGTATAGADYTVDGTGSVTFGAWSDTAGVLLWLLPDDLVEGDETVVLTVEPGDGYDVGAAASQTLTITDVPTGPIAGRAWYDANGNGWADADEAGAPGVVVTLTGGSAGPDGVQTVTDAGGGYRFDNLSAGAYSVRFDPPSGSVVGTPSGGSASVTLEHGTQATVDAGLVPAPPPPPSGTVVGRVWADLDGDG